MSMTGPIEESVEEMGAGAEQMLHPQQFQHHISQYGGGPDRDEPFRVLNAIGVRRW